MPISLAAALDEIATVAGGAASSSAIATLRQRFAQHTGAFGPEDAWFEARSRAFLDWAVTRGGFARQVEAQLSEGARAHVGPLERAHRGLFEVSSRAPLVLRDHLGGAEFAATALDAGLADALAAAESPLDGYLVGVPLPECGVYLLPGAVFHPDAARAPIERVLATAKTRGMGREAILDALLRMERSLRALSRVKAEFAYRPEALAAR